jgi:hypothetical protein
MMFVGERSFWGNDRLEFAEAALRDAHKQEHPEHKPGDLR